MGLIFSNIETKCGISSYVFNLWLVQNQGSTVLWLSVINEMGACEYDGESSNEKRCRIIVNIE